jgi:hypothetical protein
MELSDMLFEGLVEDLSREFLNLPLDIELYDDQS